MYDSTQHRCFYGFFLAPSTAQRYAQQHRCTSLSNSGILEKSNPKTAPILLAAAILTGSSARCTVVPDAIFPLLGDIAFQTESGARWRAVFLGRTCILPFTIHHLSAPQDHEEFVLSSGRHHISSPGLGLSSGGLHK